MFTSFGSLSGLVNKREAEEAKWKRKDHLSSPIVSLLLLNHNKTMEDQLDKKEEAALVLVRGCDCEILRRKKERPAVGYNSLHVGEINTYKKMILR